jgi:uncharacterized membrane protein YbaN (DUF454 family)
MLIIVTRFSNTRVRIILNNSTYGRSRLFWYDHQAWAQDTKIQTCLGVITRTFLILSKDYILSHVMSAISWASHIGRQLDHGH